MLTIELELPDEVVAFIKDELKQEPKTWVQNEIVGPVLKKFEESVKLKAQEKAEQETATVVASAKKGMKIKLSESDKKKVKK